MPSEDPWYFKLLDRLGVNTTKRMMEEGPRGAAPHWMRYQNKICPSCHAINERHATRCASCERRLPPLWAIRALRLMNTVLPENAASITMVFFALIILNFAIEIAMGGMSRSGFLNPAGRILYVLGSYRPGAEIGGDWWRAISFGLVHGGLIHFGFNAYVLWQIGPIVEMQLSRARMLVLVTLGQTGAALACYVWYYRLQGAPTANVVGASGWLFGLIGYGIVFAHRQGIRQMRDSLVRWALIVLVFGFFVSMAGGGISNAGHIGGLLGGFAFAAIPEGTMRTRVQARLGWGILGWASFALWAIAVVMIVRSIVVEWPQLA